LDTENDGKIIRGIPSAKSQLFGYGYDFSVDSEQILSVNVPQLGST